MRLTEEMVIARSKQSDLNSIRRLNLWGSELSDVSIIKRMGSIEVLALSVNNISSLQPFEKCHKLQELYLRRNKVSDFKELEYLQNLPKLKHLWLDENPFSTIPGINYRAKVLSMLPNLVKLDDKEVTQEDLEMAEQFNEENALDSISPPASPDMRDVQQEMLYEDLSTPPLRPPRELQRTPPSTPTHRQQQNNMQMRQQPQQSAYQQQQQQQQQQYQQQISPQKENGIYLNDIIEETKPETDNLASHVESPSSSSQLSQEAGSNTTKSCSSVEESGVKEGRPANGFVDRSPGSDLDNTSHVEYLSREQPMHPSCSVQSMKEYYHSDRASHPPGSYRHSQNDLTEWEEHQTQQPQQNAHLQQQHNNHYGQSQPHYQSGDIYGSTQTINYTPRNSIGATNGQRNGNPMSCRENGDEWDDGGRSARTRRSESRFFEHATAASNPALHHHGYHRRPASRSANLLSATLCLIKELDYSSLEVIEHAVRCRIDELSSD